MKEIKGSIPAIVTPFKDNKIDEHSLRGLIDWHISCGSHGIVVNGTTGEATSMSFLEKCQLIDICVSEVAGRVNVIVGVGSSNTDNTIKLAKYSQNVGADALLLVTPAYIKPTSEGIFQHFKKVDSVVDIPIIIYNIPGRTCTDIPIDLMQRLYELKNIVGVKDATNNIARVSLQRMYLGKDFIQLSGDDMTTLAAMAAGASGSISVTANVAPKLCAKLISYCWKGNYQKALEIQDILAPLHEAIFLETGIVGAKFGLSLLKKIDNSVRLPLVELSPQVALKIENIMKQIKLL